MASESQAKTDFRSFPPKNTKTQLSFAITGLAALTSAELAFHQQVAVHICAHTQTHRD